MEEAQVTSMMFVSGTLFAIDIDVNRMLELQIHSKKSVKVAWSK